DESGIVSWCSQQRGTPGIPLLEYTRDDMEREYITEKWCAPTCTIQCVHQVGHLDAWRDPQISLNDYNGRQGQLKKETVAQVLNAEYPVQHMANDERPLKIPLLLGTNREGRESEKAARWVHRKMTERGIDSKFFDVAEFDLPRHDYGTALGKDFPEWRNAIIEADGLVIVTPEYNHGYPGVLKSVMDLLLREYVHKAVGLVGVSSGPWGGTRVIEACLPMVRELGLAVSFRDLHFPRIK